MTTTHVLVPLAGALAFADRPLKWKLILVACIVAAIPDIDGLFHHFLGVPPTSVYSHRGATHSLIVALGAGLIAAAFHKRLDVRSATAGVVISATMASHCLLDMMTKSGLPVACLWPLSSARLLADWRPFHSFPVQRAHLIVDLIARAGADLGQIIVPMFAFAFIIRSVRAAVRNAAYTRGQRHSM